MNPILFRDLLMNMLLGLTALVILVLPTINPPAADASSTPPGNMTVSIAWPEGNSDVDLWVTGPGQKTATGYSNRGGSLFNLLRDDLGTAGDSMPLNYENAYSRGLPDGEYIVNVHAYKVDAPTQVAVEVTMGNAEQTLVFKESVTLRPKEERTVVRFKVKDGAVVAGSVGRVWKPLREAKK